MATGTLYLRPSEDISLNHDVYPSSLGAGYLAINEEVNDGDATYLKVTSPSGSSGSTEATSIFKMSLDAFGTQVKINKVLSATTHYVGTINSAWSIGSFEILIGETICVSSNTQADVDSPDLVDAVNSYMLANNGALPEILLRVYSSASTVAEDSTDSKGNTTTNYTSTSSYVYQVYIELDCEYEGKINTDIHRKINGEWKAITSAYKKQNGSWTEMTMYECRLLLSSSRWLKNG
jgi:hypothetical protein